MRPTILSIAVLVIAVAMTPAWAAEGRGRSGERGNQGGQGGGMSAGQAAETVRRETGGRVLSVDENGGGYRVKVLTPSGDVRSVKVPRRR